MPAMMPKIDADDQAAIGRMTKPMTMQTEDPADDRDDRPEDLEVQRRDRVRPDGRRLLPLASSATSGATQPSSRADERAGGAAEVGDQRPGLLVVVGVAAGRGAVARHRRVAAGGGG